VKNPPQLTYGDRVRIVAEGVVHDRLCRFVNVPAERDFSYPALYLSDDAVLSAEILKPPVKVGDTATLDDLRGLPVWSAVQCPAAMSVIAQKTPTGWRTIYCDIPETDVAAWPAVVLHIEPVK